MSSLREVAAVAGVSRMTVSNVINGHHHKVSAATIARVRQVIADLEYVPDAQARSLAANRSRMIGMVIHHPDERRDSLLQRCLGQRAAQRRPPRSQATARLGLGIDEISGGMLPEGIRIPPTPVVVDKTSVKKVAHSCAASSEQVAERGGHRNRPER